MLNELIDLLPRFSAFHSFAILDRTDFTLTAQIYIAPDLYVHLYTNAQKNKLNLALIHRGQRLYGEDAEGGIRHLHPFEAPGRHVPMSGPPSLEAFLSKVQQYLEEQGLI
ncbi:hypothetical protein HYR54_09215 [Candidatus Acetothermia bacterium]|nr:hypothetical protein [Candidatus Acetothermia bacterium]